MKKYPAFCIFLLFLRCSFLCAQSDSSNSFSADNQANNTNSGTGNTLFINCDLANDFRLKTVNQDLVVGDDLTLSIAHSDGWTVNPPIPEILDQEGEIECVDKSTPGSFPEPGTSSSPRAGRYAVKTWHFKAVAPGTTSFSMVHTIQTDSLPHPKYQVFTKTFIFNVKPVSVSENDPVL